MSNFAKRRIVKELKHLTDDSPPGIIALPFSSNMMIVHAIIQGPFDSEWETGIFHLILQFPSDYPTKPPNIRFLSKMFHPNIYPDGRICLDILQKEWGPGYEMASILTSIQSLLADPNVDSPASIEAAEILKSDKEEYTKRVVRCVQESWSVPNIPADVVKAVEE